MFGSLLSFATKRITERTVDAVERQLVWGAIGAFLLAASAIFVLIFLFWVLKASFGTIEAAAILAIGCAVLGLIGFWMPSIISRAERSMEEEQSTVDQIAETVEEEAEAAVDYLGPLQVLASAFMVGLSAGRSMRSSKPTASR